MGRKGVTLICIQNWQNPDPRGYLEMIGSKPLKGQQSVYKIQLFKHSETVAGDHQRSVMKVT